MAISIEYFVRREAARLLRASFPGLFFCLSCRARFLRSALDTTYTKGQIEGGVADRVPNARITDLQACLRLR